MSTPAIDIDAMSPTERVRLIGELWDSLSAGEPPLSEAQRQELARRSEEIDADVAAGRPLGRSWVDVRARIEARRTGE